MTIEVYAAFVLAAAILLILPGPTILLVISHAVTHGRKSVIPLAVGVTLGEFTAMVLSLLGLGAVLAMSAALFSILKWVGAVYLIWLGVKLWKANPDGTPVEDPEHPIPNGSLLRSAFVVTALNPKSIGFFVAFLPQFIQPGRPALPQMVLLGVTFLVLAGVNAALYAFFAGTARETMTHPKNRARFNRCGGTVLIGAGLLMAAMKRS